MKVVLVTLVIGIATWTVAGTAGKPTRNQTTVPSALYEIPVFSGDSIPEDSIPPPKYDFLIHDSLITHYFVEDTMKYTYNMIDEDLQLLRKKYPAFVHPVTMGKSEFGLEMSTVRIGRPVPKKRCVYLVRNVHAREDYSSKLLMKFL